MSLQTQETENDNPINQGTRNLPNNTNNDREVRLPNKIKALSGRKFKGDELTTYRVEIGLKTKEIL